ncbi:MAG: zinc-ribbon domain-containing protein [Deltaproteobacteria bacterium]|nr:zinc-ribbon domain-containing protein [Deltaproteobacteria bacterium]MBW2111192.1 zinc-ribbon domain-containing protein [Deltaproteobacteria bacterium]MBW2353646.1 zinc-ribbon domain-containing protein [Deltaproteobacteria bacterium]HDZ90002.1 hypothetical protein [Deltaproteobacteria bacterium]
MEIVCHGCQTRLSIPDEKLPLGQRVSVRCPKCGKKLVLDTAATGAGPADTHAARAAGSVDRGGIPDGGLENQDQLTQPEDPAVHGMDDDTLLDSYEEGEKLALVMNSDQGQAEKIRGALQELGFRYVPVESTADAVGKMRFHHFDLVVLSDNFEGLPLEKNPVLQYLNNLSMFVRRRMFVALTGERFRTMDRMAAFALSANLVIGLKDLHRLLIILKRSMSEKEKFYKVFFDTLGEVGKA